ncbi:MAG: hypothetical protein U0166_02310 [Acidobacteriota bacterium]
MRMLAWKRALPVALAVLIAGSGGVAMAAGDADKDDTSKKSFKHPEGDEPPAMGEVGYVKRAKVDLMSAAAAGTNAGSLEGGTKVTVNEDKGDMVKVTAENGPSGYMKKEDLRKKEPVEWKSNRKDIVYQECLGKDCKGKKAKEVGKDDVLLEVDRGGPDNAFIYVKMPGGVWGWVPIAYMMEWTHKYK